MSNVDNLKIFAVKYKELGAYRFYRFLMVHALNKLVLIDKNEYKSVLPNLELIEYHDKFIILYRREGDEIYLEIAKLFRKVAHKIYRIMLKKNMTPPNRKFLTLV